jgi:tRNA(fMet)-specific endonuclease VapC
MDAVLIDTDVFSFFFKRDSRRELYVDDVIDRQLYLSFMSVAELRKWAIVRNWGRQRRARLWMRPCGIT